MIDTTGKARDWWPDLTGQTVAILAAGPSITREQCDLVRGTNWFSFAINETWRLAQWSSALYGCDWQWWAECAPLRDAYEGLRIVGFLPKRAKGKAFLPPEMGWQAQLLRHIPVTVGANRMQMDGTLGSGRNSAFQVANFAVQCGAKRLILLGVDCHSPNKHWHGVHQHRHYSMQHESTLAGWREAWRRAAPQLDALGVEVVNCSPGSAVDTFPKVDLADVIRNECNG